MKKLSFYLMTVAVILTTGITAIANNANTSIQTDVAGQVDLDVEEAVDVDAAVDQDVIVYPIETIGNACITIKSEDMIVTDILVVNTMGMVFDWTVCPGTKVNLPLAPGKEMQISLGNAHRGQYFVIFHGSNGEKVIERIVKN